MIRLTFHREGAERRRDRIAMENFYYSAIYQVLQAPANHVQKATTLKRLKAKIIRPHSIQQQGILLDNGDPDKIVGEELSIHNFISAIQQQKARTVTQIYDQEGTLHKSSAEILRTFAAYMRRTFDHVPIADGSIKRTVDCGLKKIPSAANPILEEPITMDELLHTLQTGKTKKAPGRDGIRLEFFKRTRGIDKAGHAYNDKHEVH